MLPRMSFSNSPLRGMLFTTLEQKCPVNFREARVTNRSLSSTGARERVIKSRVQETYGVEQYAFDIGELFTSNG